jgi:hypothetical protein
MMRRFSSWSGVLIRVPVVQATPYLLDAVCSEVCLPVDFLTLDKLQDIVVWTSLRDGLA